MEIPSSYSGPHQGNQQVTLWWEQFNEPTLNVLVSTALSQNLDIRQAWQRLAQARALVGIAQSGMWPQINARGSVNDTHIDDTLNPLLPNFTTWGVGGSASYEIDLWDRIGSQTQAAKWREVAAQGDVDATAMAVAGGIVEFWLIVQEQHALLALLDEQMEVNRTLLELVELRYTVSTATALDVYQQRQALAGVESQIPRVQSVLQVALSGLQVLLGEAPSATAAIPEQRALPELPPFPAVGAPADLLLNRPDLRAAHAALLASDYDVGAAIADRLPTFTLSFAYDITTTDLSELLRKQVRTLLGQFFAPLIDGGRRGSEVERRRAVVEELAYGFTGTFVNAVKEVEDALKREQYQIEFIDRLQKQQTIAEANLNQAKEQYVNGLSDYLTVIAALQSLQNLQRSMINEKRQLLSIRAQLHRSLGGSWELTS